AAPRILHIATHGFFLSTKSEPPAVAGGPNLSEPGAVATGSSTQRASERASELTRGIKAKTTIANTLLRSGLALAGANLRLHLDMFKGNTHLHPFYWPNFIQSGWWADLAGKRASLARQGPISTACGSGRVVQYRLAEYRL